MNMCHRVKTFCLECSFHQKEKKRRQNPTFHPSQLFSPHPNAHWKNTGFVFPNPFAGWADWVRFSQGRARRVWVQDCIESGLAELKLAAAEKGAAWVTMGEICCCCFFFLENVGYKRCPIFFFFFQRSYTDHRKTHFLQAWTHQNGHIWHLTGWKSWPDNPTASHPQPNVLVLNNPALALSLVHPSAGLATSPNLGYFGPSSFTSGRLYNHDTYSSFREFK